jgi:glycosyltransferase involved in cell wall biosynthesis
MRRPQPLRVLMVVEQLRRRVPGGSGTYAKGLLLGLRAVQGSQDRADPEVTLYASRDRRRSLLTSRAGKQDPLESLGFPVVTALVPGPLLTRSWDRGIARAPGGFSIVHGASLAVPQEKELRTIVTVHDLAWRLVPEAYPKRGREWHEKAFLRSVEAGVEFVVPSLQVAAEVRGAGADGEKVVVIEPGSDHLPPPVGRVGTRKLDEFGVRGPFVLSVGTLEPRKNLVSLIDAFDSVRSALGADWSLVIVGPQGWGPGISAREKVVLVGAVTPEELSSLYSLASMVAYVPFVEGYGLPPLEAMRAGAPVVASKVPSIGEAARVVDPYDTQDIAKGILEVASDEGLRKQLVERGLQRAASLTWRRCARGHLDLWVGDVERPYGAGQ